MKKKVLIGFLLAALCIIGGFALLLSNLDPIIKSAIERNGSAVTGSEVRASGVEMSSSTGEGIIADLEVGNPPSFDSLFAFKINHIVLKFDKSTLLHSTVVINEIIGLSPRIIVNYDDKNRLNLQVIEENAQKYSAQSDTNSGGRKLIIDDFLLSGAQVQISHKMLKGRVITAPLADIHLVDIGKKEGGASPAEITKQIVIGIMQEVIKDVNVQLSKELQEELRSSLSNLYQQGSKAIDDKLKGLTGQ